MVPCHVKGLKPLSAFSFSSLSSAPLSAASIHPAGRLSCSHERNPARNSRCSGVSSFVQRIARASPTDLPTDVSVSGPGSVYGRQGDPHHRRLRGEQVTKRATWL